MNFIKIPDTHFLVPELDNVTTVNALKAGRLDWEESFRDMPELNRLKPNDLAIDVGAFIGDTTLSLCKRTRKVLAFEARADVIPALINNCPDATVFNTAVGDGSFYGLKEYGVGGNLGARPIMQNGNRNTLRLDDLHLQDVKFLKIDVEGSEMAVLDGVQETIQRCLPMIHIELNITALDRFGKSPNDILRFFAGWKSRETFRTASHWDVLFWS